MPCKVKCFYLYIAEKVPLSFLNVLMQILPELVLLRLGVIATFYELYQIFS